MGCNYKQTEIKKIIKMRFYRLTILISILVFLVACQNKIIPIGNYGGIGFKKIEINANGTYDCYIWIDYNQLYNHQGKWKVKKNYLILNSYRQHQNKHLFLVNENYLAENSHKKKFQIISGKYFIDANGDSIMFCNRIIYINNNKYELDSKGRCEIDIKRVKTIKYDDQFTNYPTYKVKNKNTNTFIITLIPVLKEDDNFREGTYFTDEKFIIKRDTLISSQGVLLLKNPEWLQNTDR